MTFFVVLGVLTLAFTGDAGVSMHNPFYCYSTDPIRSTTTMGSVVTSYEAVRQLNFTTLNPYTSTCTPSRFWYLGRHGVHLPIPVAMAPMLRWIESSVQADIVSSYEEGRTTLCRSDYESIRDFTMESEFGYNFTMENAGTVTEAGVVTMQNIARRFQQTFPNILTDTYSSDRFHFRHTNDQADNTSIRAFTSGLFGEAESQNVNYEDVPAFDWFLRPYSFCPLFNQETSNSNLQQNAFRQGPESEEMVEQVNRKLGFHASNQLNFQQIIYMWYWCRFKTVLTFNSSNSEIGEHSPWCAPFSVAHHHLLEYHDDLLHFYSTGYGIRNERLLANLNCGALQDLLIHMQSNNDADQKARIFVAHFRRIQLMLAALGIFRDTWPIHQHNFAQQTQRHFRSSLMALFSSNLAVVRYDCDDDDGDHDLIFLLNERPVLVPGCDQQTGVCKLSAFVNRFQRFINANCAELFCSND